MITCSVGVGHRAHKSDGAGDDVYCWCQGLLSVALKVCMANVMDLVGEFGGATPLTTAVWAVRSVWCCFQLSEVCCVLGSGR